MPSYRPLWKAATRALVAACEAMPQTGPERAAAILGVAPSTITKWCADQYDHLMPGPQVMLLEFAIQRPVFAQAFASLTGCRVTSADADATTADATLMASFFATMRQLGDLSSTWTEAASDGVHTPAERAAIRAKVFETIDLLAAKARELSMTEG